jgi:hypothetical protein
MPSSPPIVHARRFRIVRATSLALGAMLFAACKDSPVAPPGTGPALVGSLSERGGSASERTFTFTTIDIRGAVATQAFGINARGDIVGEYTDGTARSHGYVIRDGQTTTIDYPGAVFTHASAIGPGGDIVGFYRNAGEPAVNSHGFMRTKEGAFVTVDDPGHINTVAEHILPDGTILGCRHDLDQMNTMRGIIVSRDGSLTELDLNGSMANGGTPDHRRVVGFYYPDMTAATHQEGFLINDGAFTQLHVPGSAATQAWDMNPAGEIVGFYRTTAGAFHGFVLNDDEQYVTFDVPGATATRLRGINPPGDIVGTYAVGTVSHGFVATR